MMIFCVVVGMELDGVGWVVVVVVGIWEFFFVSEVFICVW